MDIVKRLRETYSATYAFTDIPHIGREAADEIERLRELCREAYHELNCGEDGDVFDRTHACGKCDSSIDRNGTLRGKLALTFMENEEVTK
jgi:hypothetical protein